MRLILILQNGCSSRSVLPVVSEDATMFLLELEELFNERARQVTELRLKNNALEVELNHWSHLLRQKYDSPKVEKWLVAWKNVYDEREANIVLMDRAMVITIGGQVMNLDYFRDEDDNYDSFIFCSPQVVTLEEFFAEVE